MISDSDYPVVIAALNALSAFFLGAGYVSIRMRHITLHRVLMLSAVVTSTLFLVFYIIYHVRVGSVGFGGKGWVRPVYFTILITHILLAAALLPLVLVTLYRAFRSQFEAHRRLARWTFPIWMYVSVTGVVIYVAVYHIFGPAPQPIPPMTMI